MGWPQAGTTVWISFPGEEKAFADKFNATPKAVNMVTWGSNSPAQSLINEELIDESRLVFCPVV